MLAALLTWLGSFLSGPLLTGALDAYRAKLAAGNNAETIAADLAAKQAAIDQQREQIEQATLTAEEGKFGPWVRYGFAFPFVVFNAWVIVHDRMFHLGVTDPLSPELLQIEGVIIAAYFGHSAIAIAARAVAGRKA